MRDNMVFSISVTCQSHLPCKNWITKTCQCWCILILIATRCTSLTGVVNWHKCFITKMLGLRAYQSSSLWTTIWPRVIPISQSFSIQRGSLIALKRRSIELSGALEKPRSTSLSKLWLRHGFQSCSQMCHLVRVLLILRDGLQDKTQLLSFLHLTQTLCQLWLQAATHSKKWSLFKNQELKQLWLKSHKRNPNRCHSGITLQTIRKIKTRLRL